MSRQIAFNRRALLLPPLALLHLALLVLLLRPAAMPARAVPERGMAVVAIAEPAARSETPAVREITLAAAISEPVFDIATPPEPVVPGNSGAANPCSLIADVGSALRQNAAAAAAISQVPSKARSVANAVMLWDGEWIDPADIGGVGVIDPIRTAIVLAVRAAPPECSAAMLTGPRIIVLPQGDASIVLAFGSGAWSWAQVAA